MDVDRSIINYVVSSSYLAEVWDDLFSPFEAFSEEWMVGWMCGVLYMCFFVLENSAHTHSAL